MRKITAVAIYVFALLLPMGLLAQKKKETLAILENKEQTKEILNHLASQKEDDNKVLVIYNNKFYSLSDFNLADTLSKHKLTMQIVNNPDYKSSFFAKHIKSTIVLEKQETDK